MDKLDRQISAALHQKAERFDVPPALYGKFTPQRARPRRAPLWTKVAIAATVLLAAGVAAVPQARAQVAGLLSWVTFSQRETKSYSIPGPNGESITATDAGQINYQRSEWAPGPDVSSEKQTTFSLEAARQFLGVPVALPQGLEGEEMLLTRYVAKDGTVVRVRLASPSGLPEAGITSFFAEYRADGTSPEVSVSYGGGYEIKPEERTIGRMQAKIFSTTQGGKKPLTNMWVKDGNWSFELHGSDLAKMISLLESMQ